MNCIIQRVSTSNEVLCFFLKKRNTVFILSNYTDKIVIVSKKQNVSQF